jgi:4-diphosphocytidyl-2-C-methyl-D-erythritol kinase
MSDIPRHAAPAKLTLTLRVLGTRPDGFHDLEALTVSVTAPGDSLTVVAGAPGVRLTVHGPEAAGVPTDATNLVARAAHAVLPDGRGIDGVLTKWIPAGAGLGGGSSDAAAALRACGQLFDVPHDALVAAAAATGSDVPFCLQLAPAWMRGRGEVIDPVVAPEAVHVLIVVPPFRIATPPVYAAWDDLGGPRSTRAVAPPSAVAHLVEELVNDLEPAAERVEPRLGPFRADLEAAARAPALLAGSGSACFVTFDDADACERSARRVEAELSLPVHRGVSIPTGAIPATGG